MQNVMQIATNAGHTAQNDGRTMQNDGCTTQNDGCTTQNDGRNTLNVCQGPKGGGLRSPRGPRGPPLPQLTKSLTYIKSLVAKNKYENGLLVVLLY